MKITLDVQDNKASAFLNFLRTLDFIKISKQESDISLSEAQKVWIDDGLKNLDAGASSDHSQVMEETRNRYPDLFK